jgi:hypothetical protein
MESFRKALIHALRLCLCCALSTLTACSALRRPPPAVDLSHDPRIQADVEARLAAEPSMSTGQLRVEVEGGVVLLYGTVQGIAAWECAIRNAELVANVRSVVDYLVIQRGPRSITCLAPRDMPATAGP